MRTRLWITILFTVAVLTASTQGLEDLFEGNRLHELRLYLRGQDWDKLRANYLSSDYYPCHLLWNGIMAENAGVRSRGNGSRSSRKPGLRLDFNRYVKGQYFLGLKSLVLDNLDQDPPMLRERLAMLFFRKMGMAASRETHARLYVNNEYAGLYVIVEPIDKSFLRWNFEEDDGHLYEYRWARPYNLEYLGPDTSLYCPLPFYPEIQQEPPAPELLEAMIRTVNQSPLGDYPTTVGKHLDLRQFLTYLAIENFLGEMDGFVGEMTTNNFYLYRSRKTGLFQMIPWDKDTTFVWSEHPILYNVEQNVLTRRALAHPELRKLYLETLLRAAELAEEDAGWLEREAQSILTQIRSSALEDSRKRLSNEEYDQAVHDFLFFIRERPGIVRQAVEEEMARLPH